jgi:hypothetical protein
MAYFVECGPPGALGGTNSFSQPPGSGVPRGLTSDTLDPKFKADDSTQGGRPGVSIWNLPVSARGVTVFHDLHSQD